MRALFVLAVLLADVEPRCGALRSSAPDWIGKSAYQERGLFSGRRFFGTGQATSFSGSSSGNERRGDADREARRNLATLLLPFSEKLAGGQAVLGRQLYDEVTKVIATAPPVDSSGFFE